MNASRPLQAELSERTTGAITLSHRRKGPAAMHATPEHSCSSAAICIHLRYDSSLNRHPPDRVSSPWQVAVRGRAEHAGQMPDYRQITCAARNTAQSGALPCCWPHARVATWPLTCRGIADLVADIRPVLRGRDDVGEGCGKIIQPTPRDFIKLPDSLA